MSLNKSLLYEIKKLPGAQAHKIMAPSGRVVDWDFHQIKKTAKHSAVVLFLYKIGSDWYTVLMKRNSYNGHHSNQVSLPGGGFEMNDKILKTTAKREFREEVGVDLTDQDFVGKLSELFIPPSNFYVQPFLAISLNPVSFYPDKKEVQRLIQIPLKELYNTTTKVQAQVALPNNSTIEVPAYKINKEIVWGATAMILSELEFLIKRIENL